MDPVDAAEQGYAELALLLLRSNEVSPRDILDRYTRPMPRADRAMEQQYYNDTGVRISMRRVKQLMTKMVAN